MDGQRRANIGNESRPCFVSSAAESALALPEPGVVALYEAIPGSSPGECSRRAHGPKVRLDPDSAEGQYGSELAGKS
jgi:hypothetical protein